VERAQGREGRGESCDSVDGRRIHRIDFIENRIIPYDSTKTQSNLLARSSSSKRNLSSRAVKNLALESNRKNLLPTRTCSLFSLLFPFPFTFKTVDPPPPPPPPPPLLLTTPFIMRVSVFASLAATLASVVSAQSDPSQYAAGLLQALQGAK